MANYREIHVGDIGTRYKARILDGGANLDPTEATTKTLIFYTPSGPVERNASITTDGASGTSKQKWYLYYDVVEADIADGLHEQEGVYQWQAYLAFSDGQEYHSEIKSYRVRGNLN